MVNYCCVEGCGRNSKQNPTFNFFSLPKDKERQIQWLQAAGRTDLLGKDFRMESHRVCSRHFPPATIKNRTLASDTVPTLCLPGCDSDDDYKEREEHQDIACNSCDTLIKGFRYKCVTCKDYDLCQKCEMHETHPEHYMLRLPRPLKHALADELVENWRKFFQAEHIVPCDSTEPDLDSKLLMDVSSDDDEPITKYVKTPDYDSGVDLSSSTKYLIKQEVLRTLLKKPKELEKKKGRHQGKKRSREDSDRSSKRQTTDDNHIQEVAFADVNELKHEVPIDIISHSNEYEQQAGCSQDESYIGVYGTNSQSYIATG